MVRVHPYDWVKDISLTWNVYTKPIDTVTETATLDILGVDVSNSTSFDDALDFTISLNKSRIQNEDLNHTTIMVNIDKLD